jgi:hypothetical protein
VFVPLLGGIFALYLVATILSVDPNGLGTVPLDQVLRGMVATPIGALALVGIVGIGLGLLNLIRGRIPGKYPLSCYGSGR